MPILGPSGQGLIGPIDPLAQAVQQRALRPEAPFNTLSLVGRLGALATGQMRQRRINEEFAQQGADFGAKLAPLLSGVAQGDQGARLRAIQLAAQGLTSTHPDIQRISTQLYGELLRQPQAPQAPKTREVKIGEEIITQQFDPATGAWQEVGRAPRKAAAVPLPPEVEAQQSRIQASGRSSVTQVNMGEIGQIAAAAQQGMISGEDAQKAKAGIVARKGETPEARRAADLAAKEQERSQGIEAIRADTFALLDELEKELADVSFADAANIFSEKSARINILRANLGNLLARYASKLPQNEPSIQTIEQLRESLPGTVRGLFGQGPGIIGAVRRVLLAGTGASELSVERIGSMTEEELDAGLKATEGN